MHSHLPQVLLAAADERDQPQPWPATPSYRAALVTLCMLPPVKPACHQWKCFQPGCSLLLQDAAEAAARAAALAEAEQAAAERAAMERRVQHELEVRGGWASCAARTHTHPQPVMPLLLCTRVQCDAAGRHPSSPAMLQAHDDTLAAPITSVMLAECIHSQDSTPALLPWCGLRCHAPLMQCGGCHHRRCCSHVSAVIQPPCSKLSVHADWWHKPLVKSWQHPVPELHACPAASLWSVQSVTAAPAPGRHQTLPLQAEEAAALAAGLAAAEQRVQAAVGAREAEVQAQAEAALRASALAQAQQRVQEQVGPLQDCHWHTAVLLVRVRSRGCRSRWGPCRTATSTASGSHCSWCGKHSLRC